MRTRAKTKALIVGIGAVMLWTGSVTARSQSLGTKLSQSLAGTQTSAVVIDIRTGSLLAQLGRARAATPGSTLKPILLAYALEHGIVRADTEVYCRRSLRIAGRELTCSHPAEQPVFTAESALAESCNTWFASMARNFSGADLETALQRTGLQHASVAQATVQQRELTVLGLEGVTATPLKLAKAYRELLLRVPVNGVVAQGLKKSVDYGLAHPAAVGGVTILGKTGTARDPGETWTHGWFAGAIPGRFVIVVFVPHGDGGTAARLAQIFFAAVLREGLK